MRSAATSNVAGSYVLPTLVVTAREYRRVGSWQLTVGRGLLGRVSANCSRRSRRTANCQPAVLGDLPKRLRFGERAQLANPAFFDLAGALAGDAEDAGDLVEGAGLLAAEAPAELDDSPLAVRQVLQRLLQAPVHHALGRDLEGGGGAGVRDQIAELGGITVFAHRLVQGHRRLGGTHDQVGLFRVDPRERRDLLDRR